MAHMYTEEKGKHKAGDIEYLAVTQTAEGIRFQVKSLSPVSVGWKLHADGGTGENGGSSKVFTSEMTFVLICIVMSLITIATVIVIVRLGILPRLKKKKKAAPKRHHIDFRA